MKLINNEENLDRFIANLSDGYYYISLLARRKWCKELQRPEMLISRTFCRKKEIINKLREMEVQVDFSEVPENSFAVYITPNIRNLVSGSVNAVSEFLKNLDKVKTESGKTFLVNFINKVVINKECENPFLYLDSYPQKFESLQEFKYIKSTLKTECSKSRGERLWMDIDIDILDKTKEVNRELLIPIFDYIKEVTGGQFMIVQTRGGAHILLNSTSIKQVFLKTWYTNLQNMKNKFEGFEIDFQGGNDKFIPCPGTIQGGFVPFLEV